MHGDHYSLETKPPRLQKIPENKCIISEPQQGDRNRKTIGLSEVKLTQTEVNYEKGEQRNAPNQLRSRSLHSVELLFVKWSLRSDLKPTSFIEETRENKQLNLSDALLGSDRRISQESKQVIIGSSTSLKVVQEPVRKYDIEDNVVPSTECKDSQSRQKQQCEAARQLVNKVENMQFSVPSSIPQQQQHKTLFVKDKEYLILGSLGHGMSGEVLRVQDLSCGELRAIKCVDLNKMDKDSAQGCLDEIFLLHKLQAPCVVRMFD